MCRHLAYLGPRTTLASLVLDPPHSLLRQTWAPADMRGGGAVNADGFGIGWYDDRRAPVRYRRACPMWADPGLPELASSIRSAAVLASARNGTVGMPVVESACAPFTDGRWLFSHNGRIEGWPDSVAGLATQLPVTELMTLDAPVDAVFLWALVRARLRAGAGPRDAVVGVTQDVLEAAPASRLNVLLTDGAVVVATTCTHALWLRQQPGQVLVSSEPLDPADDYWTAVPDGQVVTAAVGSVQIEPLT